MTLRRLLTNARGATIVEFALVAPIFIMVVVGGINLSMLGFSAASLRYATEAAARCAAVKTSVCSNVSTTQAHASANFTKLSSAPATFAVTMNASCGKQVTGTLNYVAETGLGSFTVPLTTTSCFPQ